MSELLPRWVKGVYQPHSNSAAHGYTFHIVITEKIHIRGENFETADERDTAAYSIATELGIVLTIE